MPYVMVPAHRLQVEADRVQGILELHEFKDAIWDSDLFVKVMGDRGIAYTVAEIVAIRDELVVRSILQAA